MTALEVIQECFHCSEDSILAYRENDYSHPVLISVRQLAEDMEEWADRMERLFAQNMSQQEKERIRPEVHKEYIQKQFCSLPQENTHHIKRKKDVL